MRSPTAPREPQSIVASLKPVWRQQVGPMSWRERKCVDAVIALLCAFGAAGAVDDVNWWRRLLWSCVWPPRRQPYSHEVRMNPPRLVLPTIHRPWQGERFCFVAFRAGHPHRLRGLRRLHSLVRNAGHGALAHNTLPTSPGPICLRPADQGLADAGAARRIGTRAILVDRTQRPRPFPAFG